MRTPLVLVASLAVVGLIGVAHPRPAHADVKIVATVPDLASIAKEIGGKKVSVTALSLPSQDPHFVDAKPSLVLKLAKADLLIAVGLELEVGWLPSLQTQARNSKIQAGGAGFLDCSTSISVKEAGNTDRAKGDVHPSGNPHYLYDPRRAGKCAKAIADKLAAIDPDNAKTYAAGYAAFAKRLDGARADWEARLAAYKGAPVITYHASWIYLSDWLGLDQVATLEPKPGIPPTPSHVAQVIKTGKAKGAKVVLQEAYYPDKTGKLVAKKLGGAVVSLPGGADVGQGESYVDHMDQLVDKLADALK
ncbi:MAG: zinc ABC transporter substrate-binding protein [Kofleriaceae bacterium]|nr:zinc ABC transporter substrate-binding protein [Kofleriaceae bacterium]